MCLPVEPEVRKANWRITAIGVYCDRVQDYVTLMVAGDWLSTCSWYRVNRDAKSKPSQAARNFKICDGPECRRLADYRKRLIKEETHEQ